MGGEAQGGGASNAEGRKVKQSNRRARKHSEDGGEWVTETGPGVKEKGHLTSQNSDA